MRTSASHQDVRIPLTDKVVRTQFDEERMRILAEGGSQAWREYLMRSLTAILAEHYPMSVVLAEISDLTANPGTAISNLESTLLRLRSAERTQVVVDRICKA